MRLRQGAIPKHDVQAQLKALWQEALRRASYLWPALGRHAVIS